MMLSYPSERRVVEPVVATLVARVAVRARIRDAVDPGVAVVNCASTREVLELVQAREVAVAVIDASDSAAGSNAPIVTALRNGAPRLVIVTYCSLSPGASAAVLACVQCGASGLLFEGVDDSRYAMQAAIRAARINSMSTMLYKEIAAFLPQELTPLLRYAVSRAGEEPSVGGAAESLGVDRKTLRNRLRRHTTLGPREFINWVRLTIAVAVLETTARTTEQVALDFGFASGTGFRNMLRRYSGATSAAARSEGGARWLISLFIDHFGRTSAIRSTERPDTAVAVRMHDERRLATGGA